MQANRGLTDLALDLGTRHERGDGVDDHDVDRTRANEHVADFKCLLARIGLRYQNLVDIDADARGVRGIESVLGVDERGNTAHRLRFGENLKG